MSEQWVVGRFVDGRWEWLRLDSYENELFFSNLDMALKADSWYDAWGLCSHIRDEFIIPFKAAKAIAERWKA